MNTEQLMQKRYKVIADYPGSPNLGMIFSKNNKVLPNLFYDEDNCDFIEQAILDKYPHLFKPLQWWEERDEKDMPGYVKHNSIIYKIKWSNYLEQWHPEYTKDSNRTDQGLALAWHYHSKDFLPATETEYLNQ